MTDALTNDGRLVRANALGAAATTNILQREQFGHFSDPESERLRMLYEAQPACVGFIIPERAWGIRRGN